jgi:hypothetical protein
MVLLQHGAQQREPLWLAGGEVVAFGGVVVQVEQPGDEIRLLLDNYVKKLIQEYFEFDRKTSRPKK